MSEQEKLVEYVSQLQREFPMVRTKDLVKMLQDHERIIMGFVNDEGTYVPGLLSLVNQNARTAQGSFEALKATVDLNRVAADDNFKKNRRLIWIMSICLASIMGIIKLLPADILKVIGL